MSVPYSTIFNLFLSSIQDYNINQMYQNDTQNNTQTMEQYIEPWLIKSIPNFTNCQYNLEDRDDVTMIFNPNNTPNSDLGTDEQVILSNLMVIEWLKKQINDITQMNLHLQDTDFKTFAEGQNLTAKTNHKNETTEEVNNLMVRYGYKNLDFSTLDNFYTSPNNPSS